MQTLIRVGLYGAALAAATLAAAGCSNNGLSNGGQDLAVPSIDMATATGQDQGFMLPDIAGPLPDLTGDPVIRVCGGFAQPFGAFYDSTTNAWYVSNVAGDLSNPQNLKDGR